MSIDELSMTKVMVTIRAAEGQPALSDVVERYGLQPDDIDPEFGVVEIDPEDHLYVILVTAEAAARIEPGDGWDTAGPYSNPRIEPFGPPE